MQSIQIAVNARSQSHHNWHMEIDDILTTTRGTHKAQVCPNSCQRLPQRGAQCSACKVGSHTQPKPCLTRAHSDLQANGVMCVAGARCGTTPDDRGLIDNKTLLVAVTCEADHHKHQTPSIILSRQWSSGPTSRKITIGGGGEGGGVGGGLGRTGGGGGRDGGGPALGDGTGGDRLTGGGGGRRVGLGGGGECLRGGGCFWGEGGGGCRRGGGGEEVEGSGQHM